MGLNAVCLLTATIQVVFSSPAVHPDVLKEGHAILKRFADAKQEYTSHQIADVLHKKESNSFYRITKRDLRSVTEDENVKSIRLDLSSGSSLHLNLKKRSLFDSDTQFFYNTDRGRVKRQTPPQDCYATGHVEVDGKSVGSVVVSLCDGLHGTANSKGVEYYIHPVETIQGEDKVHVLSRPTRQKDMVSEMGIHEPYDSDEIHTRQKRGTVTADTYKTSHGFVIELAIFVDSQYSRLLQAMVPDREDEFVLMTLAAVQTRYSNKDNIGYKVRFKVKLLMTWYTNPTEYSFIQSVRNNWSKFRNYIQSDYKYDIYFLLTGVTKDYGQPVGHSYVDGVCTDRRVAAMSPTNSSRITVMAREIGHLLGLQLKDRGDKDTCPEEYAIHGDGFMGSGENFTLCHKWELNNFFSKGKGLCLFKGTGKRELPKESVVVPSVFPGQYQSPDEQCRMFAGEGYEYYNPFDLFGKGECALWMCINFNKTSSQYLRVVKRMALRGYPCGDKDMFCFDSECRSWWFQHPRWWDNRFTRKYRQDVTWSDWPKEWSKCSSDCGYAVQFKRRRCLINNGIFVSPYCRGQPVKARLCNQFPCTETNRETEAEIRQAVGNEVCARFLNNNVPLELETDQSEYLPTSIVFRITDGSSYFKSKGCMLTCKRNPADKNKLDGIFPDGTPCTAYLPLGDNVKGRCVQGMCKAFII